MYYLLFWKGNKITRVDNSISNYRFAFKSEELKYIIRIDNDSSHILYGQENWKEISQENKKPLELVLEYVRERFPNHKLVEEDPFCIEERCDLYTFSANTIGSGLIIIHDFITENISIFQQVGFFDKDNNKLQEYTFSSH